MKTQELTTITTQNALEVFTEKNGLDPFLEQIRQEINSFIPDTGTAKGRAQIASIAAKVAKSKTYLDGLGKELVDRLKEQPRLVDAERKRMRDLLDKWKEEVRKPLTDWENAEKERVSIIKERITIFSFIPTDETSEQLSARIKKLDDLIVDESFAEFQGDAALKKESTLMQLKLLLKTVEQKEHEQAELEQLRKQQAEREQKERDERIAKEAEQRATLEAERRGKEQLESAKRREVEARIRQENAEHEKRQAEERERALIEKQAQQIELAKQQEADRIAKEAEKVRRDNEARQADQAHRKAIIDAVITAICDETLIDIDDAKSLVNAILQNEIPHLTINF